MSHRGWSSTGSRHLSPELVLTVSRPVRAAKKYFVTQTTEQTILEILDLRLDDMGEYRVEAVASSQGSTDMDELTFNITVNGWCDRLTGVAVGRVRRGYS